MKVIYKYQLDGPGGMTVLTKKFVKFLDVQIQNGTPCLWAVVDLDETAEEKRYTFMKCGTGWEIHDNVYNELTYFRTVQEPDGLVWHIFFKEDNQ